jgi:hypothetical protein
VKGSVVVAFGVGYVIGARAGRGRYRQIVSLAQRVSEGLERYAGGGGAGGLSERFGARAPDGFGGGRAPASDDERAERADEAAPASPDLGEFGRLAEPGPLLERVQA